VSSRDSHNVNGGCDRFICVVKVCMLLQRIFVFLHRYVSFNLRNNWGPKLAGSCLIPPNSTLLFDVEFVGKA